MGPALALLTRVPWGQMGVSGALLLVGPLVALPAIGGGVQPPLRLRVEPDVPWAPRHTCCLYYMNGHVALDS